MRTAATSLLLSVTLSAAGCTLNETISEPDTASPRDTADASSGDADVSAEDVLRGDGDAMAEDVADTSGDTTPADVAGDATRDGDTGEVDPDGPTRYPEGRLHSPLSPYVVDNLRAIAQRGASAEDVFMKVGASSTESTRYLYCFAGDASGIELDGRAELEPALSWFLGGDAAGATPFDRDSEAALSGRSAVWAITGSPSPLDAETAAINPRYAIIAYGTNDMQLGTTYQSALWNFADNIFTLTDQLIEAGVVPILFNVPPRLDQPGAMNWVPSYNTVIDGLAQARQIPLFDFNAAATALPGFGLSGDDLHGNVYRSGGSARPCIFTAEALEHRMNMRNLESLIALDRVHQATSTGDALDATEDTLLGRGTADDPFVIEALPFTDLRDTRDATDDRLDTYPGCSAAQDEAGPEVVYRLTLTEPTRIRAMVFDQGDVDIDLHLLSGDSATGDACLERDHQIIQRTLLAGTYTFVLDTFVSSSGAERSGEFLFTLHACTDEDPDCG